MIAVDVKTHFADAPVNPSKLAALVRAIGRRFAVRRAVVSIGVVGDAEMRRLNRRFLQRGANTDCLSFDLSDGADSEQPRVLEVVVNAEMAIREAARRRHAAEAELALYVAHGLLHQLGFDDVTTEAADRMHRMEDEILQDLGYGLVYNPEAPK
ncbi:MAG: rRNA maturation RNase YbeY [Sedimentisphaerales bacterium]|nr:rRNA maturation RNase YbeY [Sedimentisphaerales bacterium]